MMPLSKSELLNFLKINFNHDNFQSLQYELIISLLSQNDALAVMATGSGKSLCYQFISLYTQSLVVVVSPLISLMVDQVEALSKKNLRGGYLASNLTTQDMTTTLQQAESGGQYVLFVSPERIAQFNFRNWLASQTVALLVVDEAHCIDQWGEEFRQDYGRLSLLKEILPQVPLVALTATASCATEQTILKKLKIENAAVFRANVDRSNIFFQFEEVSTCEEKRALIVELLRHSFDQKFIIFCRSRKTVDDLFRDLQSLGFNVGHFHAGLSGALKSTNQRKFSKGQLRILVATCAFGMGIDIPDIRWVVHFDLPTNIQTLYQEVGRAGRDGLQSNSLVFYSQRDFEKFAYNATNDNFDKQSMQKKHEELNAVFLLAHSRCCRTFSYLSCLDSHLQKENLSRCNHCDVCCPQKAIKLNRLKPSQNLLPTGILAIDRKNNYLKKIVYWRRMMSFRENIPTQLIFTDLEIKRISKNKPETLCELLKINGVSISSIEKYGESLLLAINGYEEYLDEFQDQNYIEDFEHNCLQNFKNIESNRE